MLHGITVRTYLPVAQVSHEAVQVARLPPGDEHARLRGVGEVGRAEAAAEAAPALPVGPRRRRVQRLLLSVVLKAHAGRRIRGAGASRM